VKAYAVVDLRVLGDYDWRLSPKKRVEGGAAAARLAAPQDRVVGRARRPACGALSRVPRGARLQAVAYYSGRERWAPLPPEFAKRG
jgi:hypothetical protein